MACWLGGSKDVALLIVVIVIVPKCIAVGGSTDVEVQQWTVLIVHSVTFRL